jgi:hypothetical protein
MSNDKTLATVKHGGCVQLGTSERERFEAYARQDPRYFNVARSGEGYYYPATQDAWASWQAALSVILSTGGQDALKALVANWRGYADKHELNALEADSIGDMPDTVSRLETTSKVFRQAAVELETALSAQPSPGGQDARAQFEEYRGGDCERDAQGYYTNARTAQDWAMWQAALAARQPVCPTVKDSLTVGGGQPVAWLVHWSDMPMESPEVTRSASRIAEVSALTNPPRIMPLYAAPTAQKSAQAVDLGPSIPSELATVAAALKRFDECAEDSGSEGCDIGRAWFDALTTMGLLRRTQRSPAVWTMTAEGERLLALIDSQAVGK